MHAVNLKRVSIGVLALVALSASAGQPPTLTPPPKAPEGFTQMITLNGTGCICVETNVSQTYTQKITNLIGQAEQRFYQLFSSHPPTKLSVDLMQGISKQYFDNNARIPGDYLSGFRNYIELRVFKTHESFANEWFDETGVKDKHQRLTQGLPGGWSWCGRHEKDSDGKPIGKPIRAIRTFVGNQDDDEVERILLHEMGHMFTEHFLLEFAAASKDGNVNQKTGTPAWLGEGIAQLFENRWATNQGKAQKALLRQQGMIYEAVKIGDYYPFKDFIEITNAHNLKDVAGNPLAATLNYAQSASVMDFMVNTNGAMFFDFLCNLRKDNFEKNLMNKDKNHIPELFSFQNECFHKAFNCDITEVEGYWKKHIKEDMEKNLKSRPELYYWIGEYYLRRGKDKANDLTHAEENFKLAMDGAPKKGEGYLGMGRMAIRKKDDENALKFLTKAAELMPKDEDALYYLGVAQVNSGKIKEAIESMNKSIAIYALNQNALAGLGRAYSHGGEYEKAMDAFERAYQVSHHPYFLMEKGQSAFYAKKYREAQAAFNTFCDWFPQDAQGKMWYGLAAWRMKDNDFAIKQLEEAHKLSPGEGIINDILTACKKGEFFRFADERDEVAVAKPSEKTDDKKPVEEEKAKKPAMRIDDE
jgi:tetratricopeptide (TPR) repeat protein